MPDWRTEGRERVKERGEGNTLKLTEGDNCIRVLPDKKDLTPEGKLGPKGVVHSPIREFRIHQQVGPDKAMVACGKDMKGGGDCWLCDKKIPELESKGKDVQAKLIGPKEKFVVQATKFNPDTQKFQAPKPWWVSNGSGDPGRASTGSLAIRVYSKIVSSRKDFVDPIKGYNLNIERTGEGLKTRYPAVEGDESPSKIPLSILALVKDLDKLIPQYDEDEQKSAYFGRPKEEDDARRSHNSSSRKPKNEDEETEEQETDTEEIDQDSDTENSDTEEIDSDDIDQDSEIEDQDQEIDSEDLDSGEEVEEIEEEEPEPVKKPVTKKVAPTQSKKPVTKKVTRR